MDVMHESDYPHAPPLELEAGDRIAVAGHTYKVDAVTPWEPVTAYVTPVDPDAFGRGQHPVAAVRYRADSVVPMPAAYRTTGYGPADIPVVTVYRMSDGIVRVGVAGARSLEHARAVAATAGHDWILATDGTAGRFPARWDTFIDYPGPDGADYGAYFQGVMSDGASLEVTR